MKKMEQPRTMQGSVCVPDAPALFTGAPREVFRHAPGTHQLSFFAIGSAGLLVAGFDEERTSDWYEPVRHRARLLDLASGAPCGPPLPGQPVALLGDVLLSRTAPYTASQVQARVLPGGERLWEARLGPTYHSGLYAAPGGILHHDPDQAGSLRLRLLPDPRRAPEPEDRELPGLPPGQILYLRHHGARLVVRTWKPDHLALLELPAGQVLWRRALPNYQDADLFVDGAGLVLRTPSAVEVFDPDAALRFTVAGARRVWVSPRWIAGVRGDHEVFLVNRRSGAERPVPAEEAPWDVALAADAVVLVLRYAGLLRAHEVDGRLRWQAPQPRIGAYGCARLVCHEGRLYGAADDGEVACWGGERC